MTDLVRQRTSSDCGICCISMLSGRPYEEVITAAGKDFHPELGLKFEAATLERLGYSGKYQSGEPFGDFVCLHRGILSPEFFRMMAWGRRALVTVPSLNNENGFHMIYYDGWKVFDPSPRKTYQHFHELKPDELTVVRGTLDAMDT